MTRKTPLHSDELRPLIKTLLGMISEKATSIHLHKADYDKVQASPYLYGLTLNEGNIRAQIGSRFIDVLPTEEK